MKLKFKPCPTCGGPLKSEGVNYLVHDEPDLTDALARLKALEDGVRHKGNFWNTQDKSALTLMAFVRRWADEIAAIRKALGATDSEPSR